MGNLRWNIFNGLVNLCPIDFKRNIFFKLKIFLAFILLLHVQSEAQLPFQNPQLSTQERAKDLVSRLTLE